MIWSALIIILFRFGLSAETITNAASSHEPSTTATLFLPITASGYPMHRALKDVAQQYGIEFVGMSLGFSPNHAAYLNDISETVLPDFNSVTPGNALKMIFLHRCPPAYLLAENPAVQAWAEADWGDHDHDGEQEGRGCATNMPVIAPSPTTTITLPSGQYWQPTPIPNSYDDWEWDWEQMDGIVLWAKDHGVQIYGTPLIWNHAMAEWLVVLQQSGATEADMRRVMRDHIRTIMYHYCQPPFLLDDGTPIIYAYDVVNEAVHFTALTPVPDIPTPTASPVGLGSGTWSVIGETTLTGNNYVRHAFTDAREVLTDPLSPCYGKDIKLIYNDRWTQTSPILEDGVYTLSHSLLYDLSIPPIALEVPLIDGVGMQMHYEIFYRFPLDTTANPVVSIPSNSLMVEEAMQKFADLGLEVKITEVDVALIQVARPPEFCGFDVNDPRVTHTPVPEGLRPLCSLSEPGIYFELPSNTQPMTDGSQAYIYGMLAEACRDVSTCTGFTIWGLEDEGSWKRQYHPLLFTKGVPTIYTVTPTPTATAESLGYGLEPLIVATSMSCESCNQPDQPLATPSSTATYALPQPRMTPKPAYFAVYDAWAATPTP